MEQRRYSFILEAQTPIAHHAETFGNVALAARRKVRQSDGSFAMLPMVSADSMRHGLRESAALAFLVLGRFHPVPRPAGGRRD